MQKLHYCRNVGNEKHGVIDDPAQLFMVVLNNYERTPTASNCSRASSAKHPKTTAGPPPM
jgi:hypothetical protein